MIDPPIRKMEKGFWGISSRRLQNYDKDGIGIYIK